MHSSVIFYGDLNCPFCYALNERLGELEYHRWTEWRGVEHAPNAPSPWVEAGPVLRVSIEQEARMVRRREPDLPLSLPRGQPNTGLAIAMIASAALLDRQRSAALRTALYRALWVDGLDVSDPNVIVERAVAVGLGPFGVSPDGRDIATRWQAQWKAMPRQMIPVLSAATGQHLFGLGTQRQTRQFYEAHVPALGARPRSHLRLTTVNRDPLEDSTSEAGR